MKKQVNELKIKIHLLMQKNSKSWKIILKVSEKGKKRFEL